MEEASASRLRAVVGKGAIIKRRPHPSSASRGIGRCQRPLCGARKMHRAYACPPCRIAIPGPASRRPANGAAAEIASCLHLPPAAAGRNSSHFSTAAEIPGSLLPPPAAGTRNSPKGEGYKEGNPSVCRLARDGVRQLPLTGEPIRKGDCI